jgi:SAM-dependent methyltransferase
MAAPPAAAPGGISRHLRMIRYAAKVTRRLFGRFPRECNCCGHKGRFRAFGHPPRYDAMCTRCGSLERHRLYKLWVDRNPRAIKKESALLHFAPEPIIAAFLRALADGYRSADIKPGRTDLRLDIEAIELEDRCTDVIVCFHVLEHVDDKRALAEMFRVLRPGGFALLMTPVIEGWPGTYENPAVTAKDARELHFGQWDHVRYYGADFRGRVTAAGFQLEEFAALEPDVARYGLLRGETLFIARRPQV